MTSSTSPSVPSEPTISLGRSNPETFFTVGPPPRTTLPSALTYVTWRTDEVSHPLPDTSGWFSPITTEPPTVPPRSGRAQRWPASASAAVSSAVVVPARTVTVISAGSYDTTPDGACTSRASGCTSPPTCHRVLPPTTVTGPSAPTSVAKSLIPTLLREHCEATEYLHMSDQQG